MAESKAALKKEPRTKRQWVSILPKGKSTKRWVG
eukprot:CAMPEP_0171910268 /NCGR_PEP_ID=MMETSP0993-20121228/9266_1 /TAXON_ID=483369 /ORGANISM="non described non described, Strain CCMP2098" /LENGTH=33 /DNA_ID= /DNA_START= /DNA_END= /DNA_ORIENTATION=